MEKDSNKISFKYYMVAVMASLQSPEPLDFAKAGGWVSWKWIFEQFPLEVGL